MNRSNVVNSSKTLKNVTMSVNSGSLRKQRLSNNVSLSQVGSNGEVSSITLNMREARALQKFLNENLNN